MVTLIELFQFWWDFEDLSHPTIPLCGHNPFLTEHELAFWGLGAAKTGDPASGIPS